MRHFGIDRNAIRYSAVMAVNVILVAGFGLSAVGANTTSLNPDSAGSGLVSFQTTTESKGIDTTTLVLDRDGADIPEGNWWGNPNLAASLAVPGAPVSQGPDITKLNLDRDGADIESN
jgi:hypothetical protein